MGGGTTNAMSEILSGLTSLTTSLLGIVTSVVTTIVSQPLLLIPTLMGFLYGGVRLYKALRHG